jgi:hypothetical protein
MHIIYVPQTYTFRYQAKRFCSSLPSGFSPFPAAYSFGDTNSFQLGRPPAEKLFLRCFEGPEIKVPVFG